MGLLQDLIMRAKSVLDDPPPPTARHVVEANSFDRQDWQEVQEQSSTIRQEVEELSEQINYAPDLMADLHAGLYKVAPRMRHETEMAETHRVNHAVMSEVLKTPEVKTLRQHTVGDKFSAAMGMQAVQSQVVETMQRVREAQSEAQRAADDAAADAEAKKAAVDEWLKAAAEAEANPNGPLDPEGIANGLSNAMDQFDGAKQAAEEAQEAAQQAGQQAAKDGMQQVRSAAKQATEELDQQQALMSGFGVDDGEVQRMSMQERLELARKLKDNRLAQFIKLLGQFKAVQRAESRKRVVNAASEVHGITQSNELSRMVAGEYLNFADESLQTLMLLRWAEHQLNTYDVRGKENLGQGPIIVVVDESGSMGAADVAGGTREAWSKALSLAMLDQARHRKRDFVYIGFSSAGQQHMVEFPGGVTNLEKVITMTEHFFGGGTHYEAPLMQALKYIEAKYDERQLERPDIVFITDDDYCRISDDFVKEFHRVKDKTSIKVYGIALGCSSSGALAQLSDNVREVTELVSDPRKVGDLFRTI